jgi:four helix bundle protein
MKNEFTGLLAFQKGFSLAMQIFELSKTFPKEEKYSLTDQIRRSSRSVCANLGEAYRKRLYEAYFISKVSDADMENTETQVWLEFAHSCQYLSTDDFKRLNNQSQEIGKLLDYYIRNPSQFRRNSEKH